MTGAHSCGDVKRRKGINNYKNGGKLLKTTTTLTAALRYAQKVTRFVSVVLIWEKNKKSLNGGRTSPNLAIKLQSWEH